MPLAWESVTGIAQILILLPGTNIQRRCQEDILIIGEKITSVERSRFLVYSSFVKRLEVFPANHGCILKNWENILVYLEDHALLPNLVSVVFDSDMLESYPQYLWTRLILSPVLQELQVLVPESKTPVGTPFVVANALTLALKERCPQLRRLTLFPSVSLKPHPDEVRLLKHHSTSFENLITRIDKLGYLCTNLNMFGSRSEANYSLPALTHLEIYDVDERHDCASIARLDLPNLRRFGAYNLASQAGLEELWRVIGPASQHVTHVELELLARFSRDGSWPYRHDPIFTEAIPFLVAHSPRITELSIHNLPMIHYEIRRVPAASVAQLLQRLPLERLCIIGGHIESMVDMITQGTFARLKKLELPHQCMPVTMLPYFAKYMHNLEYLCLDLQLETPWEVQIAGPRASALCILESSFMTHDHHSYQFSPKLTRDGYTTGYSLAKYVGV
ncbi:hypothetical protein RhiJN_03197 [Ceratobasidium sp. AG-Ba]|nr:hypothetical protein RhiJN_03197 [Ceratobasidium sp. AG-Ba]